MLYEELKKDLDDVQIKKLIRLYDGLCDLKDVTNMIFYKAGYKKAANVFIDGLI